MLTVACLILALTQADAPPSAWTDHPDWALGKTEHAVYAATRTIDGAEVSFDLTIRTTRGLTDGMTTVAPAPNAFTEPFPVFRQITTEHHATNQSSLHRITTAIASAADLSPFKLTTSSQNNDSASYKLLLLRDGMLLGWSHNEAPGYGISQIQMQPPPNTTFHDILPLTLRNFPFDNPPAAPLAIQLIPPQSPHAPTPMEPAPATLTYAGRKTISTPAGEFLAHHFRLNHRPINDVAETHYDFASTAEHHNILLHYTGPHGLTLSLKSLTWTDPATPKPD